MDSNRQLKIGKQIQRDLGEMFSRELAAVVPKGAMVTVMEVRISPDGEYARVWVSVFPFERSGEAMSSLDENNRLIRKALGTKVRNQMRVVPELTFVLDDSFEQMGRIDELLK